MPPQPTGQAGFTTTHWSVVLAAQADSTPKARAALTQLCERYWYPLYAYLRRSGHSADKAQDLTQAFLPASWRSEPSGRPIRRAVDSGRFSSPL